MDRVFEHVVGEVAGWLDEVVEHGEILDVTPLLLVKNVERVFVRVQLHVLVLLQQVLLLISNFLVPLFQLLFLVLQRPNFFVNLLFHHSVEVLLLDFELFHDAAERLFEPINLVVELFAHFQFKFGVEFFARRRFTLIHFHLVYHFHHHSFHVNHCIQI